MVYLKSCPKCRGDLTVAQDGYGAFISCLQCGFMRDIDVKNVFKPAPAPAAAASWYADKERLAKAA